MRLIQPRQGAGLKLIIIAMAAVLLGGGSFFAWSKLRGADDADRVNSGGEQNVVEASPQTETLPLGEFLVNLRSSDGSLRYLQTEVSIVVIAPGEDGRSVKAGHGGHGHDHDQEPSLPPASHRYARDVAISALSSQSFEALRDDPDRGKLKAMLQQELDDALRSYQVLDVLFTAFVMQ